MGKSKNQKKQPAELVCCTGCGGMVPADKPCITCQARTRAKTVPLREGPDDPAAVGLALRKKDGEAFREVQKTDVVETAPFTSLRRIVNP